MADLVLSSPTITSWVLRSLMEQVPFYSHFTERQAVQSAFCSRWCSWENVGSALGSNSLWAQQCGPLDIPWIDHLPPAFRGIIHQPASLESASACPDLPPFTPAEIPPASWAAAEEGREVWARRHRHICFGLPHVVPPGFHVPSEDGGRCDQPAPASVSQDRHQWLRGVWRGGKVEGACAWMEEWAGTCFLVPQAVVLGVGSELRPQLPSLRPCPFPRCVPFPSPLPAAFTREEIWISSPSLTSWHVSSLHLMCLIPTPSPQGGQRFFEHSLAVLPLFPSLARPAFWSPPTSPPPLCQTLFSMSAQQHNLVPFSDADYDRLTQQYALHPVSVSRV